MRAPQGDLKFEGLWCLRGVVGFRSVVLEEGARSLQCCVRRGFNSAKKNGSLIACNQGPPYRPHRGRGAGHPAHAGNSSRNSSARSRGTLGGERDGVRHSSQAARASTCTWRDRARAAVLLTLAGTGLPADVSVTTGPVDGEGADDAVQTIAIGDTDGDQP
jgi:hypothetical protein